MNELKVSIIFFLCLATFMFNKTLAQKLTKKELKNSEWFEDNADTICDLFSINLKVGDTIELIQRVNKNLREDSKLFGKQELAIFGHQSYSNFIFNSKSSLVYYLTTEDNPFHTIVGRMPSWKWKLTHREQLELYQSGKYQMTLKLVKRDIIGFSMDNNNMKSQKLIFVRVK